MTAAKRPRSRPRTAAARSGLLVTMPASMFMRSARSASAVKAAATPPGSAAAGRRRKRRRGVCPAAASRGASAVPMNPLAPVTRTLATRVPALATELAELLGGEVGPAVSRIRHHDVAETGLRVAPAPELPEAGAHVVVALR